MKKIATLTAIALMSVTGFAAAASNPQQAPAHQHHAFKKGELPRDLRALNLSDAQKAQIQKIMQANRPERPAEPSASQKAQFEQQMKAHQAAEQRLMSEKNFNEAEARRLITERQQRMAQNEQQRQARALQMLKMRHDIFQVLTPAQQKQWQANQAKHHKEHHHHHPMGEFAPQGEPQNQ